MALGQISIPPSLLLAPKPSCWSSPGPRACACGASSAPCPTARRPQAVSELGSAALQPCVPSQVGFHTDPGQAAAVSTVPCHPGAGRGRDLSPVLVGVGQPGAVVQGPGVRAELGHLRGRVVGPLPLAQDGSQAPGATHGPATQPSCLPTHTSTLGVLGAQKALTLP